MKFKIGLFLVLVSWLVCLNPYLIIFAGPFFIVGLVLVGLSKAKLKTKLLTIVLPIVFWYPGFLALMYFGAKRMTPETFLIPQDFRGQITLVYNEPCGETIPKVDGKLIYKIPNNGVMILTNELETGLTDQEFFFVNSQGKKIEKLEALIQQNYNEDYTLEKNNNEPPRNKVGVFHLGTGGGSSLKNENYEFHIFAVNSWDSLRVMENGGMSDKLTDSLLYICRKKK